jgi:arylsulfatase A-like enzyme
MKPMRIPLRSMLGAALVGCVHAEAPKPNIIFILADDMGWGDLGVFYQNSRNFALNRSAPALTTPNLDAMAAEGIQLRRHYCPAPVCAPSRASLLLGVHQGHANVRDNQFDKALDDNHTLGSVLKQAGYATAMIGKYGLAGSGWPAPARPELRGFDYFFGFPDHGGAHYHYPKETGSNIYDDTTEVTVDLDKCYSTDLFAARAKKWLVDQHAANASQPFFLYLPFTAPHARLDVPTQAYPAGKGVAGGLQWLGTPGHMINTASGTINSWIHPDYASATYDHDGNPATAEIAWPDYAKRHATMIRRLDEAIADLFQTLKDLNLDDNTLVVFTSDNGPHNEAGSGGSYTQNPTFFDSFGPLDGIKRDTWEGGMREPALVRWPGHIAPGSLTTHASQFHDWLPTFAELAGLPIPARTDGVSLVPTLTGMGVQRDSTIYVEYQYSGSTPGYGEFEAAHRGATRNEEQVIHVDGYKGIRYNVTAATDNFKIYDTLNDPKETTDLSGSSDYFIGLQQRLKDRVLQVRRAGGGASRPYDAALVPAITPPPVVNGLDYNSYEKTTPWVTDWTTEAAVGSGAVAAPDLSVLTRSDNVGLLLSGYVKVPADGSYTFYLTTDTGAFVRLHDAQLIDADFGYTGGTEKSSGSISLKAGYHPLHIHYRHASAASHALTLQWSGPNITKQAIPASAFYHPGMPPPAIP